MQYTGWNSVITVIIQMGFILVALQALKALHLEWVIKAPPQAFSLGLVLVAVTLGVNCADFCMGLFAVLRGALRMM